MLNQIILVGRITQLPQDNILTLAVSRSYKNENGEYETDFIPVNIPNTLIQNVIDYTKVGDVIGVKGRLETRITTDDDYNKTKQIVIIADRITFLSSSNTQTTPANNLEEGEI